ncbi:MAG TPA: squalene/phytoene synthase family protein [Flavobacteriales bacterium]|jgi:phytoene/squalene synthetase|nr:squalene/phytoene synthase family protein [Flavobacteriales bacterium]
MNTLTEQRQRFEQVCVRTSRSVTHTYSTSFSWGIRLLGPRFRDPIRSIYAFVRLADEVVDTFHEHDRAALLEELRVDTHRAIERGISCNPILHSFQAVVRRYAIPLALIDGFLESMATDLHVRTHDDRSSEAYITGSARCVGSMCLVVFCEGDARLFAELDPHACSLGSAFQKINFLRDIRMDQQVLGRSYFEGTAHGLSSERKRRIEATIDSELAHAAQGIARLPNGARSGVRLATAYFTRLFERLRAATPDELMERRFRVSDARKLGLLVSHLAVRPFQA